MCTVGFLIRFGFLLAAMLTALRIAGLESRTPVVSGAIFAAIFGPAAQQTLGNLIAGVVLISARPFRVGVRIRLQSGGLAGEIEGAVSTLGLLYTTFVRGRTRSRCEQHRARRRDRAAAGAVVGRSARSPAPRREVQRAAGAAHEGVRTPVRSEPHIGVEGIDSDEIVVRIAATPSAEADGRRLADEILAAIPP